MTPPQTKIDDKVRSILRPRLLYKSMGENEKASLLDETIRNTLKHRVTGKLHTWNRNIATPPHVYKVISSQERSQTVFWQKCLIDRDENTLGVFRSTIRID